jgi:hypothetical protein
MKAVKQSIVLEYLVLTKKEEGENRLDEAWRNTVTVCQRKIGMREM